MADIDLGEVAEKEIAKRDRKIDKLQGQLEDSNRTVAQLKETLGFMKKAKVALLEAADYLDPYRYDDD